MYAAAGTAYVYFTYGMHFCLNVVAGRVGEPVAVLIRALEPTEGLETMRSHRAGPGANGVKLGPGVKMGKAGPARTGTARAAMRDHLLCSGPGRLCQALAIDRRLNGIDLTADSRLWIERTRPRGPAGFVIGNSPRIGVGYAGPWAHERLRWFISGNVHVSGRSTGSPG